MSAGLLCAAALSSCTALLRTYLQHAVSVFVTLTDVISGTAEIKQCMLNGIGSRQAH